MSIRQLGDTVRIKKLGLTGEIIGILIHKYQLIRYQVEFVNLHRELDDDWFFDSQLSTAQAENPTNNIVPFKG